MLAFSAGMHTIEAVPNYSISVNVNAWPRQPKVAISVRFRAVVGVNNLETAQFNVMD